MLKQDIYKASRTVIPTHNVISKLDVIVINSNSKKSHDKRTFLWKVHDKSTNARIYSKFDRVKAVRVCGRLPKNTVTLFYYYIDYENE
jgi:hypothetical protein